MKKNEIKDTWIISSGLIGCENQCFGITERMGINAELKRIIPSKFISLTAPYGRPIFDNQLNSPWPDLAIAAGRKTIPYLRHIKRLSKNRCKTIYLQDPKINSETFDIVWAPLHDKIKGHNVIKTVTSPNRVNDDLLIKSYNEWAHLFAKFSKPLIGFLIGGKSKAYKFSHSECNKILDSIRLTLDKGNTPLITISRRTPKNLTIKIKELLKEKEHLLYDGEGPNPYFAILKASDVIVVTPDSANMVSEAISVPKPVYFIDMESHSKRFKKFINTLVNSNHIRPFQEELDFFQNKKLDATQEIVDYIHENLF